MQKILVTGSSGMLGKDIVSEFSNDYEVFGISRTQSKILNNNREFLGDLTDKNFLKKVLEKINPDIIVHCAAFVNVDKCEENKEYVKLLHVDASEQLASFNPNAKFIYISTDSVFDGAVGNYKENSIVNPLNYYAQTKYQGELKVLACNKNSLIARTNIYGFHIPIGNSLFEWAINKLKNNENINAFNDVFFNPVYTKQLARIIKEILSKDNLSGILNIASKDFISKYEFIRLIAEVFSFNRNLINPVSVDTINNLSAKRPKNMTLNVSKLESFISNVPVIKDGLKELKKDFEKQ
jgi:dTDP-4-dehydrorhamnose reductase